MSRITDQIRLRLKPALTGALVCGGIWGIADFMGYTGRFRTTGIPQPKSLVDAAVHSFVFALFLFLLFMLWPRAPREPD